VSFDLIDWTQALRALAGLAGFCGFVLVLAILGRRDGGEQR
jgi:hypothetical protein